MGTINDNGTHLSKFYGAIPCQSAAPENPEAGDPWFDSDSNSLMVYNGTIWVGTGALTTSTSTSTSSTSTSTTA